MARHNHSFVPSDVTTPLLIDCGDVQIDAYGTYDVESGSLQSVTINKREFTVAQVSAALFILCPDEAGAFYWSDDLGGAELDVLVNEAANDARDDWADWKRDQQRDIAQ